MTTPTLDRYRAWLAEHRDRAFADHRELWQWSVDDLEGFWRSIWDFFELGPVDGPALAEDRLPGARWFPEARLNYAARALGASDPSRTALVSLSQTRDEVRLSYAELADEVGRVRAGLQRLGVGRGDRVVAYLPSIAETVVAFLATASLGAIWASCSPEFGARATIDRFGQLEPTVLLAVSGYRYGDRDIDRSAELAALRAGIPSLRHVVEVPYGAAPIPDAVRWEELRAEARPVEFEPMRFDDPLFVLFTSGTTGVPKAIVHGHGGILLEHLKNEGLAWDIQPGDRFFWHATTTWMVWNSVVSCLLLDAEVVLFDGNPVWPSTAFQLELVERFGLTFLGCSPGYLRACRLAGIELGDHDLSTLRQVAVVGSPLSLAEETWLREGLPEGVLINVCSGGTDVCSGIVGGGPGMPVRPGRMSGALLGVAAYARDEEGRRVVGRVGELVIERPMPSMPVGFWGDSDGRRYHDAYFDVYPGIWRHGDWIEFDDDGTCVITGRSDATLNRGGVRIGTAEFYAVVEEVAGVDDSLVVHLEDPDGGNGRLILWVVPAEGVEVDDELRGRIAAALRSEVSARHVPDVIVSASVVPRTRTGKKLEVPVKRMLQSGVATELLQSGVVDDPAILDDYLAVAETARRTG